MAQYRTTYPPPEQPTLIANGSRPNSTSQDANSYQYKTLARSNDYDRSNSNNFAYESQNSSWKGSRVNQKEGENRKQKSRVKYSFKRSTVKSDLSQPRVQAFAVPSQQTKVVRDYRAEPLRQQSSSIQFRSSEQRSRTFEAIREERRDETRQENIGRSQFRKIQSNNEQVRYQPARVQAELPRDHKIYQSARVEVEAPREKRVYDSSKVDVEAKRQKKVYQPTRVEVEPPREQRVYEQSKVHVQAPREQRVYEQPKAHVEAPREQRVYEQTQKKVHVQAPREQRVYEQPKVQVEVPREQRVYEQPKVQVEARREQKVFLPSRVETQLPRQQKKYQPLRRESQPQRQMKIYESKVQQTVYQPRVQAERPIQPQPLIQQVVTQQQPIFQPSRVEQQIKVRKNSFDQLNFNKDSNLPEPRGEKQYLRLRERVKELESQLMKIRFLAKNRKQRCEEESKPLDYNCINALVEIYNICVSGTQQRPLNFAENRVSAPAPIQSIKVDSAPKFAPEGFSFPISANQITTQIKATAPPPIAFKPFEQIVQLATNNKQEEKPVVSSIANKYEEKPVISSVPPVIESEKPFIPYDKPFVSEKPIAIGEESIVSTYQKFNLASQKPSDIYEPPKTYEKPYSFELTYTTEEKAEQALSKVPPPPPQIPSTFKVSNDLPQINEQSQLYLKQIRELRFKIQQLETEKVKLVQKNKYYELSELTIKDYMEEIERARVDLQNYKNKEREYEIQLLQSQNNIIYLEGLVNNRPSSSPPAEPEPVVANQKAEQQIMSLQDQVNKVSEELEAEKAKTAEVMSYLERAEDYIMQLQREQYQQKQNQEAQPVEPLQQGSPVQQNQSNERVIQLEQALDQEYRNQQSLKDQYELQIRNITFELTQQINKYQTQIHQYSLTINNYEQQLNLYQTQINEYTTTIHNYEVKNTLNQGQGQERVVQKIVQKPVEKTVYVQKIVEKPVQKIVEKPVQKIVYRDVEKIIEKPVEKIVYRDAEKSVEKPVQKVVYRDVEKIVEKPVQKIVYRDVEKIVEKPVEKIVYKEVEKVVEKPIEKIVYKEKIVDRPIEVIKEVEKIVYKQTKSGGGVDQSKINEVVEQNGKKTLQIIFLMQEINRLNLQFDQVRDHLIRAQTHIKQTHNYVTELEMQVKTSQFQASGTNTHIIKIKDLENKVALLNQDVSRLQQRQQQHKAQVLQFESIITEIDSKCIQIQHERDTLVNQSSSNPVLKELEIKYQQQGQELTEIMGHLSNAQEYIRQNGELWQKAGQAYEVLPQKLAVIQMLKKDLQMTRGQNKQLEERIIQLQKLIEMMESRKPTSNAPKDFKSQQTEQSLNNYIRLYKQSQAKLTEATKQIESLKVSVQKVNTTEVTSRRTEIVSEKSSKWEQEKKELETENTQIKNHLIGAQTYIRELEEQLSRLAQQFSVIEKEHHMHKEQNKNFHASLQRAEQQMAQMERLIPKNTIKNSSPPKPGWKP